VKLSIRRSGKSFIISQDQWKASCAEIKAACEFFSEELIGKRIAKNLKVNLIISHNDKADYSGHTIWEGERNFRPREFTIKINIALISTWTSLIQTLAHEFVHIKQFALGELRQYWKAPIGVMHWYGKPINFWKTPYMKHPWEKEAYSIDYKLMKAYLKTTEFKL
jgi:hypothetical protein